MISCTPHASRCCARGRCYPSGDGYRHARQAAASVRACRARRATPVAARSGAQASARPVGLNRDRAARARDRAGRQWSGGDNSRLPSATQRSSWAAVAASTRAALVVVGSRGRHRVGPNCSGASRAPRLHSATVRSSSSRPGRPAPGGAPKPGAAVYTQRVVRHRRLTRVDPRGACRLAVRGPPKRPARPRLRPTPLTPSLTRRYDSGVAMSQWSAAPALLATAADALRRLAGPEPELTLEPGDPREALVRAGKTPERRAAGAGLAC
jgi:hypothetical protein